MGLLKLLCFRLELLQSVGFTTLPDWFLNRACLPGTEPDLLLPGSECGLVLRVAGNQGAVEVDYCRLLWRRRERRHDLADAKFRSLLLDLENIRNGVLEFCWGWMVFWC